MVNRPFCRFILLFLLLLPFHLISQNQEGFFFPEGEEGAKAMLEFVLQADDKERAALSRYLQPDKAACQALFEPDQAREIYRYQQRLQKVARIVVRPLMAEQTEYLLWETTPSELMEYSGEARNFPGGYREMAHFMQTGFKVYRFKFVQPGRKLGSAYDLLVFVNGKWCLIHRPWVVLFE